MTRFHLLSSRFITLCAILWLSACTGGQTTWTAPNQPSTNTPVVNGPAPIVPKPAVAPQTTTVKVAILLPLTGANAALGQSMLSAAQLALFDTGSENFELIPRDTNPSAQSAAQDALAQGAQLILGPVFAPDVKAVKDIAAAKNVNVIAFSTDTSTAGNNVFLMGFTPAAQIDRLVTFAAAKGLTQVGMITAADAYGDVAAKSFQSAAASNGVKIIDKIKLSPTDNNIHDNVKKFMGNPAHMNAVFMPLSAGAVIPAAQAVNLSGDSKTLRKLGTGIWDDPATLRTPSLDGAWFAGASARQYGDGGFEKKYRMTYGNVPPRLASVAYDATALAAVLARQGKTFDRSAITGANGFAGVDGIFRFNSDGTIHRGLAVMEIKNGVAVEIDPAPTTFQR